jgi:hypothetical protein
MIKIMIMIKIKSWSKAGKSDPTRSYS